MREMEERLAKQDEQIEGLLAQLQEVSSRSKEITEYEEMIDESMAECSDLKRGISDLTTQLYASLGDINHFSMLKKSYKIAISWPSCAFCVDLKITLVPIGYSSKE